MPSQFCLGERLIFASSLTPQADAAGRTGLYVSLKNAQKAWAVFDINQGNAATIALSLSKATAVAPTGATAVTELLPIWANQDTAASSIQSAQTAAASFTTSAALKSKRVIIEIDPGKLGETYDCIALVTGASNAANITSGFIVIEPKWAGATLPEVMTD